jgi:hypothetical protein
MRPRTARQLRSSGLWNGLTPCVRIYRNKGEQMVRYQGFDSTISGGTALFYFDQ